MKTQTPKGPLSGVKIVDLTSVIMGPYATRILADLGADVVKVESLEGDSARSYAPVRHAGMSGLFLYLNRNKRGVALDLKHPKGLDVLRRLIRSADVLVHSMRPAAIARIGLDYDAVAAINPGIVYCGAYGFGGDGPYRDKPAYDDIIQAGSGIAGLSARGGGAPEYSPTVLCDKLAGQAIAYAVLAGLFQKAREGRGANIEVPMFETAIEFTLVEHLCGGAFIPPLGEMGFPRVLSPMRKPYRSADGYVCILPYSTQNWRDFFAFVGRPEVMDDPRFQELGERVQHVDELYAMVDQAAARATTAAWLAFCDGANIPCMPVMQLEDLPDDPHVRAVGLYQHHEHPTEGAYRVVRAPVAFKASPFEVRIHAPRLGEHTLEVLAELGYSEDERQALVRDRVTLAARPAEGVELA